MCYCAKHKQYAQHATYARGYEGLLPKKRIEKTCSEIESEDILESILICQIDGR